jgi:hypothetical protein
VIICCDVTDKISTFYEVEISGSHGDKYDKKFLEELICLLSLHKYFRSELQEVML